MTQANKEGSVMFNMIHKPRIGVMCVGCGAYWPQFPGMKEYLCAKHEEFIDKFRDRAEVLSVGMVDTPELAEAAGRRFIYEDVDVVFVQAMTYSMSSNMVPAVKDLKVPVVLMNIQELPSLNFSETRRLEDWLGHGCTCACMPELTAMLERYGVRYDLITGWLHGDTVVDDALEKWCAAASVRRKLRSGSVGMLGHQYPGMMDLWIDENSLMQKFGMMTHFLVWEEILPLAEQVSDEELKDYRAHLEDTFDIPGNIPAETLDSVCRIYGGFMKLLERHGVHILAQHFERDAVGPEADLLAALNPATTMMLQDGIACAVEGDIRAAIAVAMLKQVAGNANLCELYTLDFTDDVVLVGHSGASDPCISDEKPMLRTTSVFHGKSGSGFTTQAVPRIGPITMMALTARRDGSLKLVAAEGMVEPGEILGLGDINCRVRCPIPMRDFVNRWCLQGPSHHGAMASGNHADVLRRVALELDIDFELICQNS